MSQSGTLRRITRLALPWPRSGPLTKTVQRVPGKVPGEGEPSSPDPPRAASTHLPTSWATSDAAPLGPVPPPGDCGPSNPLDTRMPQKCDDGKPLSFGDAMFWGHSLCNSR